MKIKLALTLLTLSVLTGCTFVGNSPMERKHREQLRKDSTTQYNDADEKALKKTSGYA